MKLIIENWRKFLSEATDEEAEMIKDAMEVPISEYPFSDIFGDSYRKIMEYRSIDPDTPFGNAIDILKKFGWTIEPTKETIEKNKRIKRKTGNKVRVGDQEFDETETVTVMGADGKPERVMSEIMRFTIIKTVSKISIYRKDGKRIKRESKKVLRVKPLKILNEMIEFIEGYDEHFNKIKLANAAVTKIMDIDREGFSGEEFEQWKKSKERARDQVTKIRLNRTNKAQKLFIGGPYVENYTEFTDRFGPKDALVPKIIEAQDYFNNGTKIADLSANYENYLVTQYFVLSRHPMDVFRMSDHAGITSCHALPSEKGMARFDDYNVCALSEVYANGMIVYSVSAKEFASAGIPPTQETMDQLDDEELFEDSDRSVRGVKPESRIRIKNVAYIDPDTEEAIDIASPQGKIYGKQTPDFDTFIYSKIAAFQKDKIQQILSKFPDGKIDLANFTRYGGSYEDGGYYVADVLPLLFNEIDSGFEYSGDVLYDKNAENTILSTRGISRLQELREELEGVVQRLNSDYSTFKFEITADDFGYLEDPEISHFEMTGELNIRGEMRYEMGLYKLQQNIADAVDEMSDLGYFTKDGDALPAGSWQLFNTIKTDDNRFQSTLRFDSTACSFIFGDDINAPDATDIESTVRQRMRDGFALLFDRVAEGGVNSYVQMYLQKSGIFTSEQFVLNILFDDHDIPNDMYWDEDEIEEDEDDEGNQFISSAKFSMNFGFDLAELASKILGVDTTDQEVIAKHADKIKSVGGFFADFFNTYFMNENYIKMYTDSLLGEELPKINFNYEELSREDGFKMVTSSGWDSSLDVEASIVLSYDRTNNLEAAARLITTVSSEEMEQKLVEKLTAWTKRYKEAGLLAEVRKKIRVKIIRG